MTLLVRLPVRGSLRRSSPPPLSTFDYDFLGFESVCEPGPGFPEGIIVEEGGVRHVIAVRRSGVCSNKRQTSQPQSLLYVLLYGLDRDVSRHKREKDKTEVREVPSSDPNGPTTVLDPVDHSLGFTPTLVTYETTSCLRGPESYTVKSRCPVKRLLRRNHPTLPHENSVLEGYSIETRTKLCLEEGIGVSSQGEVSPSRVGGPETGEGWTDGRTDGREVDLRPRRRNGTTRTYRETRSDNHFYVYTFTEL